VSNRQEEQKSRKLLQKEKRITEKRSEFKEPSISREHSMYYIPVTFPLTNSLPVANGLNGAFEICGAHMSVIYDTSLLLGIRVSIEEIWFFFFPKEKKGERVFVCRQQMKILH
jgi:hypothetical protein